MPEDLGDKGVAEKADTIACHGLPATSSNVKTLVPSAIPARSCSESSSTAKAEELLAEEQAGFRPGRSTVEQIFNSRVIIEKHLQHQRDQLHNFIDFKKIFDRVWHAGLWQVLRSFNIDE